MDKRKKGIIHILHCNMVEDENVLPLTFSSIPSPLIERLGAISTMNGSEIKSMKNNLMKNNEPFSLAALSMIPPDSSIHLSHMAVSIARADSGESFPSLFLTGLNSSARSNLVEVIMI